MIDQVLLRVRDLSIDYRTGRKESVSVIRDVNLDIYREESVALVGESGSGKTTLALAILRLLPKLGAIRSGSILFQKRDGEVVDVLAIREGELRRFLWTEAAVVYQGAQNSLNPLSKIRTQFIETARAHDRGSSVPQVEVRAAELLSLVQLEPTRVLSSYPHELSGGMRQRVLIALSLLLDPQLIVLDEPTTALDILTQRAMIKLLRRLQEELHFAMLIVSHDLALAAELVDRVATMYAGRIVELGDVREIFYRPKHPYTVELIKAVVPVSGELPAIKSIAGSPPDFGDLPPGCAFSPRCAYSQDVCRREDPPLLDVTDGHSTACFFSEEVSFDRKRTAVDG